MSKLKERDLQIKSLEKAYSSGDIQLYNQLKEEYGFQELWEELEDKSFSNQFILSNLK